MKREIAPDFLKGICIFLMIYGHITYVGDLKMQQINLNQFIYTFHMPIFLLISGFLFSFVDDVKIRALNVIRRIGVPYLLFISLYLIGLIFAKKIGLLTSNQPPESFFDFFKVIIIRPYGGYWFLHSLFIIQLSILFLSLIVSGAKNIILVLLFSLVIFITLHELQIVSFRISVYFLIGLVIGLITNKKYSAPILPNVLMIVVFIMVSSFDLDGIYGKFSAFEVVWCLLLFSTLWSISEKYKNSYVVQLFSWLGRNTLTILVLHALFISLMKPFNEVFMNLDSTGILQSIFVTIFVTGSCLLTALVFDKYRLSRFLFGTSKIYSPIGLDKS